MERVWNSLLALILVAWMGGAAMRAGGSDVAQKAPWQDKVAASVLAGAAQGKTEFLVFMAEQADLSAAAGLSGRTARSAYIYQTLSAFAETNQSGIRRQLQQLGAEYQPFWVANMLWVRGDAALIQALAERSDVSGLYANRPAYSPPEQQEADRLAALELAQQLAEGLAPLAVQWNLNKVQAPAVWDAGFQGQGIVIAGQDTGYQWDHPALINQYRGWDGLSADHNYNWHDAIHENDPHTSAGNPCGFDINAPCDDHGHGTHTMGTMLGDTGAGDAQRQQIGMAPAARWIACRNMEEGWGKPSTYSECYQWFIAPTDLSGANPDPAQAPDIISNSWGCPTIEGCTDPLVMQTVVENVTAAGILTVHSAGNEGPACSSVTTPAGIYADSFTVANTDSGDSLAGSSSRGPVAADGSGRLKPDIAAPGSGIYSSYRGGVYATLSGTSMAAPHVAGLAALILSARPDLSGQPEALRRLISQSAARIVIAANTPFCGGTAPTSFPNNYVGWGRIDAGRALQAARLRYEVSASAPGVVYGGLVTYTLTVSNTHPLLEAQDLFLDLEVPSGSSLWNAPGASTADGQTLTWQTPALAPGASWQVQLVLRAASGSGLLVLSAPELRSAAGQSADEALPEVQVGPAQKVFLPGVWR